MTTTETASPTDGAAHAFDPRWIALQRTEAWIHTAVTAVPSLVGVVVAWAATGVPLLGLVFIPVWLLVVTLVAWQLRRWPAIAHRYASYRVDDLGLEVSRGVYWRKITTVPRSRVQHTDVSQGPMERHYGLGTLIVYTAGTAHSKVTVPGLDFGVAQAVRTNLLPHDGTDAV